MKQTTFRGQVARKLLSEGMSVEEVAERSGLSISGVLYHARELSLVAPDTPAPKRTKEPRNARGAMARALLIEGYERKEVAKLTGLSLGTVENYATKLGLLKKNWSQDHDWAGMQAALDDGHKPTAVADMFDFPRGSLTAAIRRGHLTVTSKTARVSVNKLRALMGDHPDAEALAKALFEGLTK